MKGNKSEVKVDVKDNKEEEEKEDLTFQNRWTLYYQMPSKGQKWTTSTWSSGVTKLGVIDSVDKFWMFFNNLTPPSKLPKGSNYHLFKGDIRPEWEDPSNESGGKWKMTLAEYSPDKMDKAWMESVMNIVGDQFTETDEICGLVLSIRTTNRLALWTKNADSEAACRLTGTEFIKFVGYKNSHRMPYIKHSAQMNQRKPEPLYQI